MADRELRRIERALLFEEEQPLRYLLELSRQGVLRQQLAEIPAIAIPATESSARILGELDLPILFLQCPKVNEFAKDIHAYSRRSGDFLVFDGTHSHHNYELMGKILGLPENRVRPSQQRKAGAIESNKEGTVFFTHMEYFPEVLDERLIEYLTDKRVRPFLPSPPSPELKDGSKIFLGTRENALFEKNNWRKRWKRLHPYVLAISLLPQSPS